MVPPKKPTAKDLIPPRQTHFEVALDKAWQALGEPAPDRLAQRGATPTDTGLSLPVLGDTLTVRLPERAIVTSADKPVSSKWQILVLHYLSAAGSPDRRSPSIVFADLPEARTYAGVYQGRVVGRLCGTVGRDAATLRAAGDALGARWLDAGDLALEIDAFPLLPMRLIWYAGDQELPPSASLLLPDNVAALLCVEDIVVLSECLVSRLAGKPF